MRLIIVRLIATILVNLVLFVLFFLIEKRNAKIQLENIEKEQIIVKLPRAYLWLGCVSAMVSVLFSFFVPSREGVEFLLKCVVVIGFFFMGILLSAGVLVWRIDVYTNKDFFLYRTVFGRKYKIFYSECKFNGFDSSTLKLRAKNKKFYIDIKAENFQYFYEMLEENKEVSSENNSPEKVVVKTSKANFAAACLFFLFSVFVLTCMTIFQNETADGFTYLLWSVFLLLSIFFIVYTLVWKIEMISDENYFKYRTMFGRTYIINYSDCNFSDKPSGIFKLKTPKRTFYIDAKAKNFETFFITLQISKAIRKKYGQEV